MAMTMDVLDERTFRPARMSSALALVLAAIVVAVQTIGEPRLVPLTAVAVGAGVIGAIAVALTARDGAVKRTVGMAILPVAALALVGTAGLAFDGGRGTLDIGYTLVVYTAALGGVLGAAGLDRGFHPATATKRAGLLFIVLTAVSALVFVLGRQDVITVLLPVAGDTISGVTEIAVTPSETGLGVGVFFALAAVALGVAYHAVSDLTTHGRLLLTRRRRDAADRLVKQVATGCKVSIPVLGAVGSILTVAVLAESVGSLPEPLPQVVREVVLAPAVRTSLLAVTAGGIAVSGVVRGLVTLRRLSVEYVVRTIVPLLGGFVGVATIAVATTTFGVGDTVLSSLDMPGVRDLVQSIGMHAIVVAVTAAALFSFTVWIAALVILRDIRVLPRRTPGMALAAGGVLAATVVDPPSYLFAGVGVAATLVVWDTGVLAVELGDEVGRHSPTRLGELVHVGGSIAVGIVGVVSVLALHTAASAIRPDVTPQVALVGLLAALAGTFVVLTVTKS